MTLVGQLGMNDLARGVMKLMGLSQRALRAPDFNIFQITDIVYKSLTFKLVLLHKDKQS